MPKAKGWSESSSGSSRDGQFKCKECSPPSSWDTYRKLSYHRENQHRMKFDFEVNGQTVIATRDAVDHKLGCPRCSGRWSDLNSFKKHVREVCLPPAPALKRTGTRVESRRRPLPADSHPSPLSSVTTSSPPVTPDDTAAANHATSLTLPDEAFSSRRPTSPLSKPKGPAHGRYRMEPIVETIVFPSSVIPPPSRSSRLRPTENPSPQLHQAPLPSLEPTPTLPTSARTQRKRLTRAVDGIWAAIERKSGKSLNSAHSEQGMREEPSFGGEQLVEPWWDVRRWKGDADEG